MEIDNKNNMFRQPNSEINVSEQVRVYLAQWMNRNSKLPMKMPQMLKSYQAFVTETKFRDQDGALYRQIKSVNLKAIREDFKTMMRIIFVEIEPELNTCFKNGSLVQVYDLIQRNLNRDVFPNNYRLRGLRQNAKGNINQGSYFKGSQNFRMPRESLIRGAEGYGSQGSEGVIFAELFEIMYELIAEYQRCYRLQKGDNLDQAAFESLLNYVQENPNSLLVKLDKKQVLNTGKWQNKDFSFADVLYDLLGNKGEENNREYNKENNANKQEIQKETKARNILDQLLNVGQGENYESYKGKVVNAVWGYAGAIYNYATGLQPTDSQGQQGYTEPPKQLSQSTIKLVKERLTADFQSRPVQNKQIDYLINIALKQPTGKILSEIQPDYRMAMVDAVTLQLEQDFCSLNGMKNQVFKQLTAGIDLSNKQMDHSKIKLNSSESYKKDSRTLNDFGQWVRVVIILYRSVEKQYDPYRRRLLKKILKHFNQSNRMQADAVACLKVIESVCFPRQHLQSPILKMIRNQNPSKGGWFSSRRRTEGQLALEKQFDRIHNVQLQSTRQKQRIQLVRLSRPGVQRRVVNLLVSGFLSEDTDKVADWKQLVKEMPDSEMYSVCWAGNANSDLSKFAFDAVKDMVLPGIPGKKKLIEMIGGPYLKAAFTLRKIYQTYNQNPFQLAFQNAKLTGQYLAQLIISTFKGHIINLMGFSLGAEVIKSCLVRLSERRCLHMINKVVVMGGVSDTYQFLDLFQRAEYPLDVLNLYTLNDSVLRYLFRIIQPNNQPIGLCDMIKMPKTGSKNANPRAQSHEVKNVDCTDYVDGHTNFKEKMNVIARVIEAKDQ